MFREAAVTHSIPYFTVTEEFPPTLVRLLQEEDLELGVAINWPWLIPKMMLRTAKRGFLNLHAGLLPQYRGNACANWAILEDAPRLGFSIHFMEDETFDSGPIVAQEWIENGPDVRVGDVMNFVSTRGVERLAEIVTQMINGIEFPLHHQDSALARECFPRRPQDGEIDWRQPAEAIIRLVRSLGPPYPHAYSYYQGVKVGIVHATKSERPPNSFRGVPGSVIAFGSLGVEVAAGDGNSALLEIWGERAVAEGLANPRIQGRRARLGKNVE